MNIVWGIILSIVAAVLIVVYGRWQYCRGWQDGLKMAKDILDQHIKNLEEKERNEHS